MTVVTKRSAAKPRVLTARTIKTAVAAIAAADPRMALAIERVGPCTLVPRTTGTHFDHLARAIVYQQLSGKAAATIYGRFVEGCGSGGADGAPTPEAILAHDDSTMRACGLSAAKTAAIRDLAQHVADGRLPLDDFDTMSDEAIIESLVAVRGIGVWTAQMFLMLRLWRADVLPVLDLGVRKGAQRIYRMRAMPEADRLEKVARTWRPWASVGSWYCWRVLDLENAGGW